MNEYLILYTIVITYDLLSVISCATVTQREEKGVQQPHKTFIDVIYILRLPFESRCDWEEKIDCYSTSYPVWQNMSYQAIKQSMNGGWSCHGLTYHDEVDGVESILEFQLLFPLPINDKNTKHFLKKLRLI